MAPLLDFRFRWVRATSDLRFCEHNEGFVEFVHEISTTKSAKYLPK